MPYYNVTREFPYRRRVTVRVEADDPEAAELACTDPALTQFHAEYVPDDDGSWDVVDPDNDVTEAAGPVCGVEGCGNDATYHVVEGPQTDLKTWYCSPHFSGTGILSMRGAWAQRFKWEKRPNATERTQHKPDGVCSGCQQPKWISDVKAWLCYDCLTQKAEAARG